MTAAHALALILLVAGMALMTALAVIPVLLEREAERAETAAATPPAPIRSRNARPTAGLAPLPVRRAA